MSIKKTGKHNTTNISFNRIFCQDYKILWTLFYFVVEFGYRGNISQAITLFRVLYLWAVNSTQLLQIFCLVALLMDLLATIADCSDRKNNKITKFLLSKPGANRANLGFNSRSWDPKYKQISLLVVYSMLLNTLHQWYCYLISLMIIISTPPSK